MRLIDADKLLPKLWVCYEENKPIVDAEPTVEAIPVEWLKKKAQEFAERYWNKKDEHKKLILPMADCPIVIQQMIKEWRVENDTD